MNSCTKLRNIPHIRSNSSEKSTSFNGKAGEEHRGLVLVSREGGKRILQTLSH